VIKQYCTLYYFDISINGFMGEKFDMDDKDFKSMLDLNGSLPVVIVKSKYEMDAETGEILKYYPDEYNTYNMTSAAFEDFKKHMDDIEVADYKDQNF